MRIRGGPAGKIHCAVKKLQLSPGKSNQLEDERVSSGQGHSLRELKHLRQDYLLWLGMKSVKEIRIEELVGEIERVALKVDKGDEHVDHVKR